MDVEGSDNDNVNGNSSSSSVFPGYTDVNDFSQKTLRAVLMATRSSNDLPIGDDFDFYSTFRSVRDVLDIEGRRILTLLQRLLRHQNVKGNLHHGDSVELEDQFDVLMDANDQILERAGTLLDEASGLRKEETKLVIASTTPSKVVTSWNKKPAADVSKPAAAYRLMTARNIQRPQLRFREKIDNSNLPFKPVLRHKPHALKSLEDSLKLPDGVSLDEAEQPDFIHPHPYSLELQSFQPGSNLLKKVTPQEPQPLNLTPLLMVDTVKQLEGMIEDLKTQTEIAVDLEHHNYRSFQGLTCLMQISTRSRDYIIDTLELRNEIYLLGEVFADPKIMKVLHGADSDIGWLQRDFGLYMVNMFDTGQAARVLGFSRFSLAHLLLNYCHIEADKQFQLADWRIRPLPTELINYAREDTHYLLYIYDMMRNQLIDRGNEHSNLLLSVYDRSKNVASKVYQKPSFSEYDFMELYKKSKKVFNSQQLAALRDLYSWRDGTARLEDESLGYVLPNHMLLQIAEILPRERQGVLACCNPIPPLVRQSLVELHNMVLKAREIIIAKVEKPSVTQPSKAQHPMYDANSLLNCPHDLTHMDQRVAQIEQKILETGLIASSASMFSTAKTGVTLKQSPLIAAFSTNSKNLSKTRAQTIADSVRADFRSTFSKYLPQDENNPIKPERGEIWTLKPPTSLKRKADDSKPKPVVKEEVDLDSFQPEFVPPTKRAKINLNLSQSSTKPTPRPSDTSSASEPTTTSSSGLFRIPEPVGASKPSSTKSKGGLFRVPDNVNSSNSVADAEEVKTSTSVEKQIKSIRQEMNTKKKKDKKKKAKRERELEERAEQETSQDSLASNSEEVPSITNITITSSDGNRTTMVSSSSSADDSSGQGKKDKKKKKKKLTIEDVEKNFAAFDYSAAEKNMAKEKAKKPKMDVFNAALPSRSGKHKDKARKPKLAGPNSKKSFSFGPGSTGQGGKKKQT